MASGEGSKQSQDGRSADQPPLTASDGPAGNRAKDSGRVARRAKRGQSPWGGRVLPLSVALIALGSAGAIVWYGYGGGMDGGAEGEVPIISASETPERVQPDEPGGLQIPFQDNAVLNNGEAAGDKVERILPPPEEPMEIARAPRGEVLGEELSEQAETQRDGAPLVALPEAEEKAETESGDPIGDLVAQMTDGATDATDRQVATEEPAAEAPADADDRQAAQPAPAEMPSQDSASTASDDRVVPATVTREIGATRGEDGGAVESLLAKPASQSPAETDEQSATTAVERSAVSGEGKQRRVREFPIVLPPRMPTVDLNGQGASDDTTGQASADPEAPAPQVAATTPAVDTESVDQSAKQANGTKREALPTASKNAVGEQKAAKPIQVAQPRMQELPDNSYVIQVASLRSEDEAKGFWSRAQAKHPDLLETMPLYVERADLGDRGIYFRVQTGPFPSKTTAQDLCGQLKSAGQDCIVKRR